MTRASVLFVALILVFLPGLARADSFHQVGSSTIFQSRDRSYRLRAAAKPWQLAEQTGQGSASVLIGESLFSFFDGVVFRSTDGLRFERIAAVPVLVNPYFRQVGDVHLLVGRSNDQNLVWIFQEGTWQPTSGVPQGLELNRSQFGRLGEVSTLVGLDADQLTMHSLAGNVWQLRDTVACASPAKTYALPVVGALCADGASWMLQPLLMNWEPLFGEAVNQSSIGDRLAAALSQIDGRRILLGTETATHVVELSGIEAPTGVIVAHDRVLLTFPTVGLQELLWQASTPTLQFITPTFVDVVSVADTSSDIFVSKGTAAYFSGTPGIWQQLTSVGGFNHARAVSAGWLVWQTNATATAGGLTQLLSTGQTNLVKVNPWASTTSPIQATSLGQFPAYVGVVTSSGTGNVNLYKTSNFLSWSRITLPSVPTLVRSVAAARELSAGTLLEVEGTISVAPGVVSDEVAYLQDAAAGIQLYLSQSKGSLGVVVGQRGRVTGEISSSQAKRILLEAVDDWFTVGNGTITPETIRASEVDQAQGLVVHLRAEVTDLSTDSLSLDPEVKVHLDLLVQAVKDVFRLGDVVEIPAVVDWNSSSSQTEAWYLGTGHKIIERVSPPAPAAARKPSKASPAKKSTQPKATTQAKAVAQAATSTTAAKPVVRVARVSPISPPLVKSAAKTADEIQVAPQAATNNINTTALSFLGIITGMLAIQGRRFRQLLS